MAMRLHNGMPAQVAGQVGGRLAEVFARAGAPAGPDPRAPAAAEAKRSFQEVFAHAAEDKGRFDALMQRVFGDGYDRAAAEQFRQRALAGDFSWLPPIRFVDDATLQGGLGAFAQEEGVVYLNESLAGNPDLAAKTYMEEVGHFLDARINGADTAGDEGEMFRRMLGGESLSAADEAAIRAEDDAGTITVDGKQVQVEFWNPFKAVKKAVGGVVDGVKGAVGGVVDGVKNAAGGIWDGVKKAGAGLLNTVFPLAGGLLGGAKNLVGGLWDTVKEAGGGLLKGLGKAAKLGGKLFNGALGLVQKLVSSPLGRVLSKFMGPLGWAASLLDKNFLSAIKDFALGIKDAAVGAGKNLWEGAETFGGGFARLAQGDFTGALKDWGSGLLKTFVQTPVDAAIMVGGKSLSAVQTAVGLEPPGRGLTPEEIAALRKVYGDSIDYGSIVIKEGSAGLFTLNDRPFVLGNTIYIKDGLTKDDRLHTLVHEVAHTWQHQNGGTDYISDALWAQNFGDGYDWRKAVDGGKRWHELNPEQQAELIADASTRPDVARDYAWFLAGVWPQVVNGQGAT